MSESFFFFEHFESKSGTNSSRTSNIVSLLPNRLEYFAKSVSCLKNYPNNWRQFSREDILCISASEGLSRNEIVKQVIKGVYRSRQ